MIHYEIIRCHLPIVDMNDVICQIFVAHYFLLMSLLENAISPWVQSWESAHITALVPLALVLVQNPFLRLSPW